MPDTKTDTIVKPRIAPDLSVAEPPFFKVIYINDEQTTMEFVVETLKVIFDYDENGAIDITKKIHEDGSAVVAVLPFEIAEQKGIEVTILARNNGFPLQVKIEANQ